MTAVALAGCGSGGRLPDVPPQHLWLSSPTGTEPFRRLTVDVRARRCVVGRALPDGQVADSTGLPIVDGDVAYVGTGSRIWFARANGRPRIVARTGTRFAILAAVDRGHAVYAVGREIVVVGARTLHLRIPGTIRELTAHDGRYATNVLWGAQDQHGAVYVVTDGTARRIGTDPFPNGDRDWLTWAPDGSRLVLGWDGDMWTIRPDGRGLVRLTHTKAPEGRPVWSPDSTRVAYFSIFRKSGLYQVYVAPATGGGETQVTDWRPRHALGARQGWQPARWLDDHTLLVTEVNGTGVGMVGDHGGKITLVCRTPPGTSPIT